MRGGWGGLSRGPRGQANVTVSSQVSHSATSIAGRPPIPSPAIPSGELLLSGAQVAGPIIHGRGLGPRVKIPARRLTSRPKFTTRGLVVRTRKLGSLGKSKAQRSDFITELLT